MIKNSSFWSFVSNFLLFALVFTISCKKEDNTIISPSNKVPVLKTTDVSDISFTKATSGGNISSDGGLVVTVRGICLSVNSIPTINDSTTSDGTGSGPYTSLITGLLPNTTYYLRAYATNALGTGYGNLKKFKTMDYFGIVKDADSNVYMTIKIGGQIWMTENLKTTKFSDGTNITHTTDPWEWANLTTAAYCNYNNDTEYVKTYGRLYNWYAVNDSRKLAPKGWHIPTVNDWETLTNYLGGESYAGGKLKECGTTHWLPPNSYATNSTGFTALPAGTRSYNGTFWGNAGGSGYWWTADGSTSYASSRSIYKDGGWVSENSHNMTVGFSVRCIKD